MNLDDRFFTIADNFSQQINAHDLVVCEKVLDFWCNGSLDSMIKVVYSKDNKFRVIEQ